MKELVVFIDSGDTLVDESTEVYENKDVVARAELFPGAAEALRCMKQAGYQVVLVADGLDRSFENVYRQPGLRDCFDGWVVSGTVGECKPSPLMFRTAMQAMGLTDRDRERIVMIGNNLERDIVGANRMGLHSILASYSPRYVMQPSCREQVPEYVAASPAEIPALVDMLDMQVKNRKILEAR